MNICHLCGDDKREVRHCKECCAHMDGTGAWYWPWTGSNQYMPTDHEHRVFGGATV
jgi:hypothetical protein